MQIIYTLSSNSPDIYAW